MAYVRRGRGLRGLGDAQCPSLEQLQGIVDINDPCQSPPVVSQAGSIVPTPYGMSVPIVAGTSWNPAWLSSILSSAVGPGPGVSSSPPWGLILGVGGGLVLLSAVFSRGRR